MHKEKALNSNTMPKSKMWFCKEKGLIPISASANTVAEYLVQIFKKHIAM